MRIWQLVCPVQLGRVYFEPGGVHLHLGKTVALTLVVRRQWILLSPGLLLDLLVFACDPSHRLSTR